jgi:hypothetical protein
MVAISQVGAALLVKSLELGDIAAVLSQCPDPPPETSVGASGPWKDCGTGWGNPRGAWGAVKKPREDGISVANMWENGDFAIKEQGEHGDFITSNWG